MKLNLYSFILFFVLSFGVKAQIDPIHYYGVKYYPNSSMIAYFYLYGIDCQKEVAFLTEQMKSVDFVNRFVINKEGNKYWGMIETNKTVQEENLTNIINGFINNFGDQCMEIQPCKKTKTLPADFPKYIDTGNPETDRMNYKKAKDEWIKQHPKEYKEINNGDLLTPEQKQKQLEEKMSKDN